MSVRTARNNDNRHVKAIRSALNTDGLPFASGHKDVKRYNLILYYDAYIGGPVMHSRIDFAKEVSDAELRQLAGSAFSGTDSDAADHSELNFSTTFDIHSTGIVDSIRDRALEGYENMDLRIELGFLSVYGSEVRSYRRVPHADTYTPFASLVVILPTNYAGGALQFQHGGEVYPFETAKPPAEDAAAAVVAPGHELHEVAYLAYHNNAKHHVDIIQSGWRVTLTYYLSLKKKPDRRIPENRLNRALTLPLQQALNAMFDDLGFVSEGGILGFGLRHRYRSEDLRGGRRLDSLRLKGSDASLWIACRWIGANCTLEVVYKSRVSWLKTRNKDGSPRRHPVHVEKDVLVLCDSMVSPAEWQGTRSPPWKYLLSHHGGRLLTSAMGYKRDTKIRWISDIIPALGQRLGYMDPDTWTLRYVERHHVLIVRLPSAIDPGPGLPICGQVDSDKDSESDEDDEEDDNEDKDKEEGGGGEVKAEEGEGEGGEEEESQQGESQEEADEEEDTESKQDGRYVEVKGDPSFGKWGQINTFWREIAV